MAGENSNNPNNSKSPSARSVVCPNCGASMSIRALGQTLTVICSSCHSILDSKNDTFKLIEKGTQKPIRSMVIPLGQRGKLRGILWEVIGFMERADDSGQYIWGEYLLFNPHQGFRWLTEFDGHWNFVTTIKSDPSLSLTGATSTVLGQTYQLFHKGKAKVVFLTGEFYWRVRVGETVKVIDYIKPPEILSCEKNDGEINWSIGTYLDSVEVKTAFSVKGEMPSQTGVAPNQISSLSETSASIKIIWVNLMLILVVIQVVSVMGFKNKTVFEQNYEFQAGALDYKAVTPKFQIGEKGFNSVEFQISSDLSNNWAEVQGDLVAEESGDSSDVEMGIEYYSGYDSDGSWSEGSPYSEKMLSSIPKGEYHFEFQLDSPLLPKIAGPEISNLSAVAVTTPNNAVMRTKHWPNGQVQSIEPTVNGVLEGIVKKFHQNGQLMSEVPYWHGQPEGVIKVYRADGTLAEEQPYHNGLLNGQYKIYDEIGALRVVVNYVNGVGGESQKIEKQGGALLHLGLRIKENVPLWGNFIWSLVLMSLVPLIILWRARSFEVRRWSQSDYSPYYSEESD